MNVKITDNAYNDIYEFSNFSRASDENIRSYISSMLSFAYDLSSFPNLGKFDFEITTKLRKYQIRKLVYEQHKILYYIDKDIHIVGFLHSKKDTNEYIKRLKREL